VETEIRPGDQSTIVLEVQFTETELQSAINEGVRHLARRTRVPGFRPGKAPRQVLERALGVQRADPDAPNPIYDEAREHLYERTVVVALGETDHDVLELPREPSWTSFREGVGASYTVRLPVRPDVTLGDYTSYPFTPQVDEVGEAQVEQVVEQLRDQQASLVPVEDRPARTDDFAVIRFEGRQDGQPVEGARAERFPLIIGRERLVPGFEAHLVGMSEGEERSFTVTLPHDYAEEELQGQAIDFTATLLELRERRLPEADDDFAGSVGPYDGMPALRADLRARMRANSLDRARHVFADRVIQYAAANATVALPDVMVDREVETMVDELKVSADRQGIGFEEYLRVTDKTEATLREDYREGAANRVKVLLVLGAIADQEGVTVGDGHVEAEIARLRSDDTAGGAIIDFLDSERGRDYIRSQLRRSQVVEALVDRWIAGHPEFSQVQHQHQPHSHEEAAPDMVDEVLGDEHDEPERDIAALEAAAQEGAAP
jgi:trigger factor